MGYVHVTPQVVSIFTPPTKNQHYDLFTTLQISYYTVQTELNFASCSSIFPQRPLFIYPDNQ
jgi:hypothetical protein